jgi:hypothetical protein
LSSGKLSSPIGIGGDVMPQIGELVIDYKGYDASNLLLPKIIEESPTVENSLRRQVTKKNKVAVVGAEENKANTDLSTYSNNIKIPINESMTENDDTGRNLIQRKKTVKGGAETISAALDKEDSPKVGRK